MPSQKSPPRKWREAAQTAFLAVGLVGATVSATPETLRAHAGPTRGGIELDCRRNGHAVESIVVDLTNRRIIPMTGRDGKGCVASMPFRMAQGGLPDFVNEHGHKLRSPDAGFAIIFDSRNLRDIYEVFGMVHGEAEGDSARVARGQVQAYELWEVSERDPERQAAVRLTAGEARQFFGQLNLLRRNANNLRTEKDQPSGNRNGTLDRIIRDGESQATWAARRAAGRAIAQGIGKIF